MYEIAITTQFTATHALRLYDGELEPVHEHDWSVKVAVAAKELDQIQTVMDFHALQELVADLIGKLHNNNLNDVEPFASDVNPSAERVAEWIGSRLAYLLPKQVKLVAAEVGEAQGCTATYRP